jgi:asparagine synthase (glutamine-hydrolysing)
MGAMAAAVCRKERNAVSAVATMLSHLTHRGVDAHGIATSKSVGIAESIDGIATADVNSSIALGHNLSRSSQRDVPQPILGKDIALVFEGRFFPHPDLSEVDHVLKMLAANPRAEAENIIGKLEGSYTFAVACADVLIAGRDSLGIYPLYYGENEEIYALASERKALWAIGVKNAKSFPPGNVGGVNEQGFSFKSVNPMRQPSPEVVEMTPAPERLKELLLRSTEKRVADLNKVAVAFSGGVDSSIIAVLAKNHGVEVHLFSVALEDQPEIQFAEAAAKALGLRLHVQTYTPDDVTSILPKVLWLIEEPSVMKSDIAIPLYWTAENASKRGYKVLLTGLGADELFGGYQKYLREYRQFGASAVQAALLHDVQTSYDTNFQRDNQVCAFHKVELRLPFTDQDVVNFALGLPVDSKIASAEDPLRKRVLRQTACRLGIPVFIANRAKQAIQYTTGVHKTIRRLAKKQGLNSEGYVNEIFKQIYSEAQA